MKRFNLLVDGWIPVCDKDGQVSEKSILGVYENAQNFSTICGETETQNVSVLRETVSVADVAVRSFNVKGEYEPIEKDWTAKDVMERFRQYWNAGCFNMEIIHKVVDSYRENFEILGDGRTYFKPGPVNSKCEWYEADGNILRDEVLSENKPSPIFTIRNAESRRSVSLPELARWCCNEKHYGGTLKKPAPGFGDGYLLGFNQVLIEGDNLFETILLNTCLILENGSVNLSSGKPIWMTEKREFICFGNGKSSLDKEPVPSTVAELYTMPSRYIHLMETPSGFMPRVMAVPHPDIRKTGSIEPMVMWVTYREKKDGSVPDPTVKKDGRNISNTAWQYIPYLSRSEISSNVNSKLPISMIWLRMLIKAKVIPAEKNVTLKITGAEANVMGGNYISIFSDKLNLNGGLLSDKKEEAMREISREVTLYDGGGKGGLYGVVGKYLKEVGKVTGRKFPEAGNGESLALIEFHRRIGVLFRQMLQKISMEQENTNDILLWWRKAVNRETCSFIRETEYKFGASLFNTKKGNSKGVTTTDSCVVPVYRYLKRYYKTEDSKKKPSGQRKSSATRVEEKKSPAEETSR